MTGATSEQLQAKKCKPCEGGVPKLTQAESQELLKSVPEWTLTDDAAWIRRKWTLKNFQQAIDFVNRIAAVAEDEGHHPDIHIVGYKNVTIELTTHAIGGLSENDFILAAKIDALAHSAV